MPKLIDYPRTSYAGAWEVADVVDDTGGKCALDTCARKLNRKVSGSFKAIIGSAVKFGLLTSKRELLTTTTLFRRIKHAYDKQEELLFHREAFLTPPLFTQLCRKFRSRELPVQMLDIMLIREFDVEEINAQSVAKAFVDGARMVGLLDERNMIADIDQLAAQQPPRRELASPELGANSFRAEISRAASSAASTAAATTETQNAGLVPVSTSSANRAGIDSPDSTGPADSPIAPATVPAVRGPLRGPDAVASLFGLAEGNSSQAGDYLEGNDAEPREPVSVVLPSPQAVASAAGSGSSGFRPRVPVPDEVSSKAPSQAPARPTRPARLTDIAETNGVKTPPYLVTPTPFNSEKDLAESGRQANGNVPLSPGGFRIELSGPGLNTILDVQDEDDLALARVLLDKIGRQLKK